MGLNYFLDCFRLTSLSSSTVNPSEDETGCKIIPKQNVRIFSYDELKSATKGFSCKIGEGGLGSVYKGQLQGGDFVAVKVFSVEVESMRGEREFISEIAALSQIKHGNLVTLRGCCVEGAKRFLVYDYMEINCLAQAFLGGGQNRMKFNWKLRRDILIGIAKGLSYLHEEINPHIVHRDIKASNILLDLNFTPKLGDFGLSKMFVDSVSHISTRVAGTLGYLSPEYATSGRLTRKSDVYSFGVLLLEIVSGLPVVDFHLQYGEQFLVEKVWESYDVDRLLELVDPVLNGDFPEEEAVLYLKIGLLCVQEIASLRPGMSQVLKMLTHEMNTDDVMISRPGLLHDLMELKVCQKQSALTNS